MDLTCESWYISTQCYQHTMWMLKDGCGGNHALVYYGIWVSCITFQNLTCPLIEWHMLAARVVAKNYHHILWWDRTTCSNIKTFLSMIAKMFEGNLCDYSKCRRNCTLTSSVRFASQLWDFKTRWNRNLHDSQFANRRRHNLKPTCFDGQSCMHSWQRPQM